MYFSDWNAGRWNPLKVETDWFTRLAQRSRACRNGHDCGVKDINGMATLHTTGKSRSSDLWLLQFREGKEGGGCFGRVDLPTKSITSGSRTNNRIA